MRVFHREVTVYHRAEDGEIKADEYKTAASEIDVKTGWLTVTLDAGRGTFRYPPQAIVKVREFGEAR